MVWRSTHNNEQQVEQLRSEMHTFQNNVLNKMQEIEKSIERDRGRIYETNISVSRIESELRQVHKLVDALVTHLLMPDLPVQKIREAVAAITSYQEVLEKRQQAHVDMYQSMTTEITTLVMPLMKFLPDTQRNTDGIPKLDGRETSIDHLAES